KGGQGEHDVDGKEDGGRGRVTHGDNKGVVVGFGRGKEGGTGRGDGNVIGNEGITEGNSGIG
ncbi:hypothetical protein KI387_033691, partial [Taxus chinensis]